MSDPLKCNCGHLVAEHAYVGCIKCECIIGFLNAKTTDDMSKPENQPGSIFHLFGGFAGSDQIYSIRFMNGKHPDMMYVIAATVEDAIHHFKKYYGGEILSVLKEAASGLIHAR